MLDHLDDLRQGSVRSDGGGPDHEPSLLIDGGSEHLVPGHLVHWQRLPGQHGLVDRGKAVFDDSVRWDLLSGQNHHPIAGQDTLDWNRLLRSIDDDPCLLSPELE